MREPRIGGDPSKLANLYGQQQIVGMRYVIFGTRGPVIGKIDAQHGRGRRRRRMRSTSARCGKPEGRRIRTHPPRQHLGKGAAADVSLADEDEPPYCGRLGRPYPGPATGVLDVGEQ